MNKKGFNKTIEMVKCILVQSSKDAVQTIGGLSEIVDENSITSFLIINMKKLIYKYLKELKICVCEDIISSIECLKEYSAEVQAYVDQYLIIYVEMYNPTFEGIKSGSDFGFVFQIPEIYFNFQKVEIVSSYNGLLVQAKRNAVNMKKPEEYRKLQNPNFSFINIRKFFSLALYKFEHSNKNFRFSDILFTPLDTIKGDDNQFFHEVNNILSGKRDWNFLNAEEFFSKFLCCEIGTKDNSKIEEYILAGKVPFFRIIIEFGDDGNSLKQIVEEKEKQLVNEKQTIRERIYTY